MATLYTIGHSTRTLDEFIAVLQAHSIQTLVDIRSFPMSRRLPHFNREELEKTLTDAGIRYIWLKDLGGRRKKIRDDSPNVALRNGRGVMFAAMKRHLDAVWCYRETLD